MHVIYANRIPIQNGINQQIACSNKSPEGNFRRGNCAKIRITPTRRETADHELP